MHAIPPKVFVRGSRECPTIYTMWVWGVGGFDRLTCLLVVVAIVTVAAVALLCSGGWWYHAGWAVPPSVHDRLQQDFRGLEADGSGDGVGDERARLVV